MRSALNGVKGVTVKSVKKGSAEVESDGSVTNEQLIAAVKKAGFGASVAK